MLEKFRQAKLAEILKLQKEAASGSLPKKLRTVRPSLRHALLQQGPGAVIAEYKRASPSRGLINARWTPREAAEGYAQAGAAALSVLTEESYFQGSLDYLDVMSEPGLPLLRKDFLLHPLQVLQTAATPASAALLIVRMLSGEELASLLQACDDCGLEAVVEVFDRHDLEMAKAAGSSIIQVNNRNLDTLQTDLGISLDLIAHRSRDEVWISASGLNAAQDIRRMREAGFDGLLIGTRLMQEPDPGAALAALLHA